MKDHRLTVSAVAERELAPDRATWTLFVRESDDDPRAAFSRCAERMRAVAEALEEAGDVRTGRVSVASRRDPRGEETMGRVARASVVVSGPVGRAGELAAAAMDAGADEIEGPVMHTEEPEELENELLAEAVRIARSHAEAMAAAAGRELGCVLAINDRSGDGPITARLLSSRGDAAEPPVRAKPRLVSAGVRVVFELVG